MGTGSPERTTGARAAWSLLRRNADFRRLFLASVISLGGDWFLFVAIGSLVYEATGRAASIGLVILAQELPFFFASWIGGILADRVDRRKLMIVCDLARAAVCVSFLLASPERLWLAFVLLAVLSIFAGPYDPAFSAATPNVVDPEDLPTANALNGSLWGTMLAVGAALGGLVAAAFGADTAFLVDAASFVVSALLLLRIRRPFSEAREAQEHPGPVEATRETVRYARRDHRVLALLVVKGGFGLAAGVLALIVVFAHETFHAGTAGYGLLMAFRGVGALIGPFLGHRLAGPRHQRLFDAIAIALAVFGLSYMALGLMPSLWLGAVAVLCAHLGGGAQWVLSTYGLQRIVPDRIRGRIFAADYALITLTLTGSALVASLLADAMGPREAVAIVGGIALVWAAVWWSLTRSIGRTLDLGAPGAPEPSGPPAIAPP
jgi:predicted MFS family arabinose efflux permease